jgi:hypothetical protein
MLAAVSHIPEFGDAAPLAGDVHLSKRWYIFNSRWSHLPGIGDASSVEDMGASPNFWICETTRIVSETVYFTKKEMLKMYETDDLKKRVANL